MSSAIFGQTLLQRLNDGQTSTDPVVDTSKWTTLAEVISLSGPSMACEPVEVTSQDSVASSREFIPGYRDAGEVSADINFIPSNATQDGTDGLLDDFENSLKTSWAVIFNTSPKSFFLFSAFATGFDVTSPTDAQLTASITLKLDGVLTMPT